MKYERIFLWSISRFSFVWCMSPVYFCDVHAKEGEEKSAPQLLSKNGHLHPALTSLFHQVFEITGHSSLEDRLSAEDTLKKFNDIAQNYFLSGGPQTKNLKERFFDKRRLLTKSLSDLGFVGTVMPRHQHNKRYDYVLILGATLSVMKDARFHFL